jgi:hypothetical protein
MMCHGIHDGNDVVCRAGQASQMAARSDTSDKNPRVCSMALHTDPIAQNRTTGNRAGGVDGYDAHGFFLVSKGPDEAVRQGRFSGARGTGNSDNMGISGMGDDVFEHLACRGSVIFNGSHEARGLFDVSFQNIFQLHRFTFYLGVVKDAVLVKITGIGFVWSLTR